MFIAQSCTTAPARKKKEERKKGEKREEKKSTKNRCQNRPLFGEGGSDLRVADSEEVVFMACEIHNRGPTPTDCFDQSGYVAWVVV